MPSTTENVIRSSQHTGKRVAATFRLLPGRKNMLRAISRRLGMSETAVVESLILSQYARMFKVGVPRNGGGNGSR